MTISQLQGGGYPSEKEDGELSEEESTPSTRVTRSTPAVKSKIVVPPNGKNDSNTDKTKKCVHQTQILCQWEKITYWAIPEITNK